MRLAGHSGCRVSTRSLAAVPQTPGWALSVSYYHSNVAAAGNVAAAREIRTGGIPATVKVNLNLGLSARSDLVTLAPSYTFATPVLGGQLSVGMSSQYARNASSIAGTLTAVAGPIVATRSGTLEGSLTSYGDLAPSATLLWSNGVNNLFGLWRRQHSCRRLQSDAASQYRARARRD